MYTEKDLLAMARIQLPQVIQAYTAANLEAQKVKPDLGKVYQLMSVDATMDILELDDMLRSWQKLQKPQPKSTFDKFIETSARQTPALRSEQPTKENE